MSYNLYLKPRNGSLPFESVAAYFSNKPHYQVEGPVFAYHNGDTGVYFSIAYGQYDDVQGYPLRFVMNYYHPSFFSFEAELELSALVRQFDLVVYDAQANGMGQGEYDGEKFITGWHHGNGFAYQAASELQDETHIDVLTLAQNDLHGMWGWNKNRGRYREHLGESFFVPQIWPMKIAGKVTTATMWPYKTPTFIPKAKFIIIPRDRSKTEAQDNNKPEIVILPWEVVEPLIGKYSEKIQEDGFLINSYKDVPDDVQSFVQKQPPLNMAAERLAFDKVLDQELWDTHTNQ